MLANKQETFGIVNIKKQGKIKTRFNKVFENLGRIGKALLFPIAVIPIAAIFLRLGAQIPTGTDFANFIASMFLAAGNTVFNNLYMLFGIGVAFGLTKDNRGEAALVGFVGMFLLSLLMGTANGGVDIVDQIYGNINFQLPSFEELASGRFGVPKDIIGLGSTATLEWAKVNLTGFHRLFGSSYDSILSQNVLNGILIGGIVAFIYNRFNGIELPKVLGFFSGRRLIPVLGMISILFFGILWSIIFPWIGWVLFQLSFAMSTATSNRYGNAAIAGVYGFLNRLLIPFGLHHIPNSLFWFVIGSHPSITGGEVYGDINIFLSGVAAGNTSGTFQTGFFPTMMFGLPALVFAFYKTAETKDQKNKVLSLFVPLALISFLTGITEPIEFAFMFVSPLLYFVYALLTGLFAFITNLFGIQIGFGFSAGFLDYLLSIPKSLEIINANKTGVDAVFANPGWLFPIGILTAITFYFTSTFMIKKLNLQTPGRGNNFIRDDEANKSKDNQSKLSKKAKLIVQGLGGWDNIISYQNCSTRLRYDVNNKDLVDDAILKDSGILGLQKLGNQIQLIIGPSVEILNDEIRSNIGGDVNLDFKDQKDNNKEISAEDNLETRFEPFIFKTPIGGKVVLLSSIKDSSFISMGKGVAIIPKGNTIFNYDESKLELGFKTGHAYIVSKHGISFLIHIGLDTSKILEDQKLAKLIFDTKFSDLKNVIIDDKEVLAKVNFTKMKSLKLDISTPIIILDETIKNHKVDILVKENQIIKAGDPLFKIS